MAPTFSVRRKPGVPGVLQEVSECKKGRYEKKESVEMHFEQICGERNWRGSVIVEVDAHGRLWLGLPTEESREGAFPAAPEDLPVDRSVDPGHLGRDGEWW